METNKKKPPKKGEFRATSFGSSDATERSEGRPEKEAEEEVQLMTPKGQESICVSIDSRASSAALGASRARDHSSNDAGGNLDEGEDDSEEEEVLDEQDDDDQDQDAIRRQKERRLAMNRESARNRRKRKKSFMDDLIRTNATLQEQVDAQGNTIQSPQGRLEEHGDTIQAQQRLLEEQEIEIKNLSGLLHLALRASSSSSVSMASSLAASAGGAADPDVPTILSQELQHPRRRGVEESLALEPPSVLLRRLKRPGHRLPGTHALGGLVQWPIVPTAIATAAAANHSVAVGRDGVIGVAPPNRLHHSAASALANLQDSSSSG